MGNYIARLVSVKNNSIVLLVLFFTTTISIAQSPVSWWNDAVFYEVFVRSFKDSDGDGKGDLKGLISKLDYLNDGNAATNTDLGVTAIWLMPIQQSPSYHGYDVIDYRTVEQDYGTNADFKKLMVEAHKRGIKVIIDYVMNHTSSQHPWFIASSNPMDSKRNWYVWQDVKPVMTGPWGQNVWHTKNSSNYYGIFWSEMPDLNYTTPEVKTEMFDVARFWLEDMDVDGFRLDAVKYIHETGSTLEDTPETIAFWKEFRTQYKSIKPDAFAVGEAWTTTEKIQPYVDGGDGLDYCFEFDLATSILSTATTGNVSGLKTQLDKVMSTYPFLQFGTFLTNHDMNRTMSQLGSTTAKAKLAADLLLTLPGVPYIYYGEEIGMTGSGVDENKRTAMQWNGNAQAGFTTGTPWRAVNADFTTKNVKAQQSDPASLWNNYRKLISLRTSESALRRGGYKSVAASNASVLSFLRHDANETILIVTNASAVVASSVQLSINASGISAGNYKLVEMRGGSGQSLDVDISGAFSGFSIAEIPAYSTLIYKIKGALVTEVLTSIESAFNVYPIPSSQELFLNYSILEPGLVSYTVSDLLGVEKISNTFVAETKVGQQSIACEGLSSGIYQLKLSYNGIDKMFKIIIQK